MNVGWRGQCMLFAVLAFSVPGFGAGAESPLVTRTLPNGVEVLVYPDRVIPMVTVELVVRNGAAYETPATSGLAHLYEHLFWPDFRPAGPGAAAIKDRGISFNASTRSESTQFFLIAPRDDLRTSLAYLRDAAQTPDFSLERVAKQKGIVIEEIRRADANPYTLMTRRVHELLFPKNRTFKSPLGLESVVANAFASQLTGMQRRVVVPGNFAVVVTGDCEPESVFRLCAELFPGAGSAAGLPAQVDPGPPPARSAADIIVSPQVSDVVIKLGWRGPGVESDRTATYAADVFSSLLQLPGARFQRTLVDTGLVIGTDVVYATQRNLGVVTFTLKCAPERAKEALRAVRREIAAFAAPDYFTDRELADARASVIADELLEREDLVRYSHSLGFWWASAGTDYLADRLEQTRRTGRPEIIAYVRRYLHAEVSAAVAVVPEGKNRRAISTEDLLAK